MVSVNRLMLRLSAMFVVRPQLIETAAPVLREDEMLPALPARWRCDLAGDRLTWTPGVFDLFGIAPGTPLDRRAIVEMYADESREMLETLRAQAIATAGSFTFEAWITRADGARRWMRVAADTWVSDRRVTHLYGTKWDITAEAR